MPARLTTRAQVNGYRFLLRRLEHALVRRDARMIHDPMRSQMRSMMVGFVICLLVVAACAVLAIFKPAPKLGDSVIVTAQSSGAMYVRFNDRLHPVLNLSSARLIAEEAAEPNRVKDKDLVGQPIGPTMGIIGAPGSINKAEDLTRSDWSVCDIRSGGDGTRARMQTMVMSSVPDLDSDVAVAPSGAAGLARSADGDFFLLYEGKRAQVDIDDPVLVNALKLDPSSLIDVSGALLESFRPVAPITPIVLKGAGRPSRLDLPGDLRIGAIVKSVESSGTHQYVVLADRLAPVSDVAADIIRFSNPNLLGDTVEIAPALLNSVRVAPGLPVDVDDYPTQMPQYVLGNGSTLCTHWFGPSLSEEPTIEMLVGTRLPLPENASPTTLIGADGSGPAVDAAYIPTGTGEFVRAVGHGSRSGGLFYISDTGLRFPIPDAETAQVLGVTGVRGADGQTDQPQAAPWSVVSLLPAGPTLSVQAARIAHGGFEGDDEAVRLSPEQPG